MAQTTGAKAMKIQAASRTFTGVTATEVVSKMREECNRWNTLAPTTSNEEYMKGVIKRFFEEIEVVITYSGTTEEEKCFSFIESLIEVNLAENITELN